MVGVAVGLTWFSTELDGLDRPDDRDAVHVRPHHPRTFDEDVPLDRARLLLALFALVMFVLCFTPAPIEPIQLIRRELRSESDERFASMGSRTSGSAFWIYRHAQRIDVDVDTPLNVGMRGQIAACSASRICLRFGALDEELRAVLAAQLAERRRRRAEHAAASPRSASCSRNRCTMIRRVVHRGGEGAARGRRC